jgi:hypothetical protein
MSDGVWKYVGWEGVVAAARRQHGAALLEELQRAARLPGSGLFQDDFTIVLLEEEAFLTSPDPSTGRADTSRLPGADGC